MRIIAGFFGFFGDGVLDNWPASQAWSRQTDFSDYHWNWQWGSEWYFVACESNWWHGSEMVYLQMQQKFTQFETHWANSLEKAIELLENDRFGVAITDVSLGGENISPVIYALKQSFPDLAVLVLTSLNDSHTLIDLINKGQVYRYLPRPSNLSLLEISIQRAYDYHQTLVNQPKLQARHVVDAVTEVETRSFGNKVKKFLSRFGIGKSRFA